MTLRAATSQETVPQKVSVSMSDSIPLDHCDVFLREALEETS